MAISKIKKFFLIAHRNYEDRILSQLKKLGIVEIEFKKEISKVTISDLEKKLSQAQFVIDFFTKQNVVSDKKTKIPTTEDEIRKIISDFPIESVHQKCKELTEEIDRINSKITGNESIINRLKPWSHLQNKLEEFSDTPTLRFIFFSLKSKDFPLLRSKLAIELYDIIWSEEQEDNRIYSIIVAQKDVVNPVNEALKGLDAVIYNFNSLINKPQEEIDAFTGDIKIKRERLAELSGEINSLYSSVGTKIFILEDELSELSELKNAESKIENTAETFILEGWFPLQVEYKLNEQLHQISNEVELITRNAKPSEIPPVVFNNSPVVTPYEFLTKMFAYPNYKELDPTPVMAPFFTLFFALCMSDAFYGPLLTIMSFILLKKFKLDKKSEMGKLLYIILFGGIVTFFTGIITNSFLGFEITGFIPPARRLVFFNPIGNPMQMLYFALILGIIHILVAMFLQIIKHSNNKNYWGVFDQVLWMTFIVSLVPIIYGFLFGERVPPVLIGMANKTALICMVLIVLTQGRNAKIIFVRPLLGLFKLYSVTGYFGDVLSYCRILALALAGTAIAQSINSIAQSLFSLGWVGYILGILVFVGGHIFNLVVNCLGALVHSTRLQYVEFFSKFYEGDGRPFEPFAESRRYTLIQ